MLDRQQAQQARAVLNDLTTQLVTLKATMVSVEARIVDLTNAIAPISSIPSEVLAAIFKEVCFSDGYHGSEIHVPLRVLPSIVLASHVNRRFRHIAINTPSLWTNVHFHLSSIMDIHLMDTYLERSKTTPLEICIVGAGSLGDVYNVIGRLLPHSGRWRSLSVQSQPLACMREIILALQHLFVPRLESIHMTVLGLLPANNQDVRIFQGGAPNLGIVKLANVGLLNCCPPLSALETLDIQMSYFQLTSLNHNQFRDISVAAPSLTYLRLSSGVFVPTTRIEMEPIDLPSLRTLVIILNPFPAEGNGLIDVFKALHMPVLQTLEIDHATSTEATCFMRFLQVEGHLRYPSLRSLSLRDADCAGCFTLDFMNALPRITSLSLVRSAEDFVLKLLMDGEAWPQLTALKLAMVDYDLLREFISSRGCRIDSLALGVEGSSDIPPDFHDWLKKHIRYFVMSTL
jgi:hypothetical protein